jgi:hypothetical protein
MARTVWLILAGAIAGSATVAVCLLVLAPGEARPGSSIAPFTPAADLPDNLRDVSAPGGFEAELAALENAVAAADPFDLEALIGLAALEPSSAGRDAELTALFDRLTTLDPHRAIGLAEQLGLGHELLARIFQLWAATDPAAALAELGTLSPPAAQRAAALALLDVFGVDAAGIERVAASFPPVEAASFRIDAIGRLAEHDLPGAMNAVAGLPLMRAQAAAYQRIAKAIARIDPLRGLAQVVSIEEQQHRQAFQDGLLDEWAKIDAGSLLSYLETADRGEELIATSSLAALATSAPEQLLETAASFGPFQRVLAQRAALDALAVIDPLSAYRLASDLPNNGDRESLIARVASSYAGRDPESALAWATSLEPRSPSALNAVLSVVAAEDPMRVTDIVIAEIQDPVASLRGEMPALMNLLSAPMQARSPAVGEIADRLASHGDPRVRAQLEGLFAGWSRADPGNALDWGMRNTARLMPSEVAMLARIVARDNPALARQLIDDHIADPELREQAVRLLEPATRPPANVPSQ